MAASDARPVPKKGVAYRLYFDIRKNDGTLITTWAGQDTELSLDGGNYADATNEATEIQTSGTGYVDLTAAETNYDCVIVKTTVTNTGALPFVAVLYPEEAGDIRTDVTQISGDATAADNLELMFDGTGYAGGTTKLAVDASASAVASVTGAVGSVTGAVGSVVAGVTLANDAVSAAALSAAAIDEILDEVVEGTTTVREALRLLMSAAMAKVSGCASNAPVFRDIGDTKNRITATTDGYGNRTAVTLDGS